MRETDYLLTIYLLFLSRDREGVNFTELLLQQRQFYLEYHCILCPIDMQCLLLFSTTVNNPVYMQIL